LAIRAEVFRVFLQPLRTSVEILPQSGHDNFLSNASITLPLNAAYCRTVFLRLSATADSYMGGQRMRGPFSYHNISLGHKQDAITPFSANRRKVISGIAINNFFLSTNFKGYFKKVH
jgi:hypothetical protein